MLTSGKIGKQNGDTRTRKSEPGYLNLSINSLQSPYTGEDYHIPAHARTERFKKSFSLSSVKLWNTLGHLTFSLISLFPKQLYEVA
jgi:ribosomal protein L31